MRKSKKNLGRLLAWVLCLCLVMTGLVPASVAEAAQVDFSQSVGRYGKNTVDNIVEVNPLYQDSITEEQAKKLHENRQSTVGQHNTIVAGDGEYLTLQEAGRELCQYMKERATGFSIAFEITDDKLLSFGNIWTVLSESAFEHTGDPMEGDYLKWSWVSVSYGYSIQTDRTTYGITIDLDIEYMMTQEEEAEVDAAVDALLSELALDGMSDLEKTYTIYDYICQTVVYDYDNVELEGDEVTEGYKHAHCIYGALMNGKAVCQGYASMLYRLLLECGIDNRLVAGGNHGWNIICIDGLYYNGDTTWDAGADEYYYFLTGSAYFRDDASHMGFEEYVTPEFVNGYPVSPIDYAYVEEGTIMTGSGVCGDNLTWELNSTGTLTISGAGSMTDLESEFDSLWDYLHGWIKNVIIEEGVTSVGNYAFFNCSALETVSLPSTLESIGDYAFSLCDKLEEVIMPDSVTSVGEGLFYADPNLKKVEVSSQLTNIENSMFDTCQGLTTVDIPDSVKSIGDYAFFYCDSLDGLVFPEALNTIGEMAFYGAFPLTGEQSLVIPDSVDTIGSYCFTLSGLTEVTWSASAARMEEGTFYKVYRLTQANLPEGVEYIGTGVFNSCNHLIAITIPSSVNEMGEYVFSDCSNLEEIRFTGSAPSFMDTTFEEVTTTVYYPASDATWTEEIRTQYGSHLTWKAYESMCENHTYGEGQPVWSWNETRSEATATFTCEICGEVQNVKAEIAAETTSATCTEDGKTVYTATCELGGATYTDIKEEVLEATGHTYEASFAWTEDRTACEATITCSACDVTASVGCEITSEDTEDGKVYTATCEYDGQTFTDTVGGFGLPFTDVSKELWYYDAIKYVYLHGLMTGRDATTFAPDGQLTRAEFSIILYRMNGEPEVEYEAVFPDVPEDIWYADAVLWAYSEGIVTGHGDGTFKPDSNITREEMAVMMYRYAQFKDYDVSKTADYSNFADGDKVSPWAEVEMSWAVGNEIITGKEEGTLLDPQGEATRAECATIMQRFCKAYEE